MKPRFAAVILFFSLATVILCSTYFANQAAAQTVKTRNPRGEADYTFVKTCGNGEGHWDCKGAGCDFEGKGERGPKENGPTPTQSPTPAPLSVATNSPQPNPQWASVSGYSSAFNQCDNLCIAYQQSNCNQQFAIQYCSYASNVDFNKDGHISAQMAETPTGTVGCEKSARCYDVIQNCQCGTNNLNFGQCVSIFYQTYAVSGLSSSQSMSQMSKNIQGSCPVNPV